MVEKRNRPPLSCEPCRSKKQSCNRGLPCDGCIRHRKPENCHYAANANRNRSRPAKQSGLNERLKDLERLVSALVAGHNGAQSVDISGNHTTVEEPRKHTFLERHKSTQASTSSQDESTALDGLYRQDGGGFQADYTDSNHWKSILNDIREVREHLVVLERPIPPNHAGYGANAFHFDRGILLGSSPDLGISDVLTSLPTHSVCDMLLTQYFNSRLMILAIIHPAKFQSEYQKFWDAPLKAPVLWIALLFSVLSMAISLRQLSPVAEHDDSIPPPDLLQQSTIQCLMQGHYITANEFALETLLLHLQSRFLTQNASHVELWFEMGTIIRLAYRMGYHRDPDKMANVSPFSGEMRRRVWQNVVQIDALMSFHMGFPSMISNESSDTGFPKNLEYSDFSSETLELPTERPLSEFTSARYVIVKASIMRVFKKIVGHSQSSSLPRYEQVTALDAEMREEYGKVPDTLRKKDVDQSFMDPSSLILERCAIEMLYLKGLIVLHRRYISYDAEISTQGPSRWACVEAAIDILDRQADLHQATQPGGRLYDDRWMLSSLVPHDFLLAAMVLCLDLSVRMRRDSGDQTSGKENQPLVDREYRALQISQRIWATNSSASPESNIATLALELMLKKVAESDVREPFEHSLEFTTNAELPYAGVMEQMIDGHEYLDWDLLDQYFQDPNYEASQLDSVDVCSQSLAWE